MSSRDSRGPEATHESVDPDVFFEESGRKRGRRKDFQLCAQVQEAIASALAAELEDPLLRELWVVRVEPAPTASQLLVWVALPPGSRERAGAESVLARLSKVEGLLRAEVASAIHRKRVPTLSYAVAVERET
jgi:ribosome-binding factor A